MEKWRPRSRRRRALWLWFGDDDDRELDRLSHLVRGYSAHDGHHLQFNMITGETRREAQAHPEPHRDLIVRVAGYSDYFCDLTKPPQSPYTSRCHDSPRRRSSSVRRDAGVPCGRHVRSGSVKGPVVGLVLDAHIRKRTDGRRSMDDVMRLAYRRWSGARGYTGAAVLAKSKRP